MTQQNVETKISRFSRLGNMFITGNSGGFRIRRPMALGVRSDRFSSGATLTWMSQEDSKRLGSVGYNPNIPHL